MTGPVDRKHDGGSRLAALLLVSGVVVSFAFGALHPGGADPNDHAAAFTEYAGLCLDWDLTGISEWKAAA